MRIGHGTHPTPAREGQVQRDPSLNRRGRPASSKELDDRVQISREARDLQSGRARQRHEGSGVEETNDRRLEGVEARVKSGLYDSEETRLALADELLTLFGL